MNIFQYYTNWHLGDIFTIFGFLGTIGTFIGLIYTYRQVRDSKSIAESTKEAVQQIENDFHKLNDVSELSCSLSVAQEIRGMLNESNYSQIPDKCHSLKLSLITARIALTEKNTVEQAKIQSIIVSLTKIAQEINSHVKGIKLIEDFSNIWDTINLHIDDIHIMNTTQKSLIGKGN